MTPVKIAIYVTAFVLGSCQFAFAEELCDPDPLGPRIDSIMKKSFPKMMAWRDGPGDKRFTEAPKKALELYRKALVEIDKLRETTCLDIGKPSEAANTAFDAKSCSEVMAMSDKYRRQAEQYKENSIKIQKHKAVLPLIFNAFVNGGSNATSEAVTLTNPEIEIYNAAAVEVDNVWKWKTRNDPSGLYGKEGTLFFALKESQNKKLTNEAELKSNELQLVRQKLACD